MNSETPVELGYRWPAEWEVHESTWLAWPHNRETWPGAYEPIPPQFARFVLELAERETVHLLAPSAIRSEAERHLSPSDVVYHDIPTNDAWVRDYGPTFLQGPTDQPPGAVRWTYNGWGEKYPPFDDDARAAEQMLSVAGHREFIAPLVLEGGAIEGNGDRVVLTTISCLTTRNAGLDPSDIEQFLRVFLAADEVISLPHGQLAGDDTDGHVDQLARFVDRQTVVVAAAHDEADENHAGLKANADSLRTSRFDVVALPAPPPLFRQGQRLPASYCNFYFGNGCVIVPEFGAAKSDERAAAILSELLPEREVIPLPAHDIVWGLGAFHCLSQQQCLGQIEN